MTPIQAQETSFSSIAAELNPIYPAPEEAVKQLSLPPGFEIDVYAPEVTGARSMTISPAGNIFVGTRADKHSNPMGFLYVMTPSEDGKHPQKVIRLADNLDMPNGVAFFKGDLFVAERTRILRYADIEAHLSSTELPPPSVIYDGLEAGRNHDWRYIKFGPDGRLYITLGAPCNTCLPGPHEGVIVAMHSDGSQVETIARGVRNSLGLDWSEDQSLWFTDNGRDLWGNTKPSEELNRSSEAGQHFGFPYVYAQKDRDLDYPISTEGINFQAPELEFPAHSALLGMTFYRGKSFPKEYQGDLFIASHGSWNRSPPTGYKIFRVNFSEAAPPRIETFVEGWLNDKNQYWGRPVDLMEMRDGSLLVSDDFTGVIYRISYSE